MLSEASGIAIDWAYWTSPNTITAYATLFLVIVTFGLVIANVLSFFSTKRQADAMEQQSKLILGNMKHERLGKELALLVGPLYSRRADPYIFCPQRPTARLIKADTKHFNEDFVTFWNIVDQYMYLNQSANLRDAYKNYKESIDKYVDQPQSDDESNKLKEKMKADFENKYKPAFIQSIKDRYKELEENLAEMERELGIQDEKAKELLCISPQMENERIKA